MTRGRKSPLYQTWPGRSSQYLLWQNYLRKEEKILLRLPPAAVTTGKEAETQSSSLGLKMTWRLSLKFYPPEIEIPSSKDSERQTTTNQTTEENQETKGWLVSIFDGGKGNEFYSIVYFHHSYSSFGPNIGIGYVRNQTSFFIKIRLERRHFWKVPAYWTRGQSTKYRIFNNTPSVPSFHIHVFPKDTGKNSF